MLLEFRNPHPYGVALLTARPHRMVGIDNVRVLVLEGSSVPVWMAMRFLSLPALVYVLMVLVMDM